MNLFSLKRTNRTALIVISLGPRPWFRYVRPWMAAYCKKNGFDFIIVNSDLIDIRLKNRFDSFRNYGRVNKLGIYPFFEVYERLILVDDSCMIDPATPPLDQLVPQERLGCLVEGEPVNLPGYLEYHKALYKLHGALPANRFVNGGVLVLSKQHQSLFEVSKEEFDAITKDPDFPMQGYISYKAFVQNFELFDIGTKFNYLGSMIEKSLKKKENMGDVKIFHLTGYFSVESRVVLAKMLHQKFFNKTRTIS